jgi:hypothetical protein
MTFKAVAKRLGVSQCVLRRALDDMQSTGFPRKHAVFKKYPVDAVEAWIRRESRIADDPATVTPPKQGVNHHAL